MEKIPTETEAGEVAPEIKEYGLGKSIRFDVVGRKEDPYEKQYEDMSKFAARLLADTIKEGNLDEKKKRIVLGLPADTSPVRMYELFAEIARAENLDLSKVFVVRYEQEYGPGVLNGGDWDFDAFHEYYFFGLNNITPRPAEIKVDAEGNEYVEGNFLPMYVDYSDGSGAKKLKARLEYIEEVLGLVGNIDFAVMGVGKDGHIIDWGRGENRLSVRHTREKKPGDYDFNYERFTGDEEFRNWMWEDLLSLAEELIDVPVDKVKEILKTTATLGIKHIIGANDIVIIAPQRTKAFTVREAILGSVDGDLIEEPSGRVIQTIKRDRELRSPVGSVLRVRNILNKPSRLVTTPEAAAKLQLE